MAQLVREEANIMQEYTQSGYDGSFISSMRFSMQRYSQTGVGECDRSECLYWWLATTTPARTCIRYEEWLRNPAEAGVEEKEEEEEEEGGGVCSVCGSAVSTVRFNV